MINETNPGCFPVVGVPPDSRSYLLYWTVKVTSRSSGAAGVHINSHFSTWTLCGGSGGPSEDPGKTQPTNFILLHTNMEFVLQLLETPQSKVDSDNIE